MGISSRGQNISKVMEKEPEALESGNKWVGDAIFFLIEV